MTLSETIPPVEMYFGRLTFPMVLVGEVEDRIIGIFVLSDNGESDTPPTPTPRVEVLLKFITARDIGTVLQGVAASYHGYISTLLLKCNGSALRRP